MEIKNNMILDIDTKEEQRIFDLISNPHFLYVSNSISDRKKVAIIIFAKKENEILLIDNYGFLIDSVFAGLSEKHIEHIAKNGPRDYKENILKILKDKEMMKGVFEIAKAMDEDMGGGSVRHQQRVKNVIQYIKDNRVAFEF